MIITILVFNNCAYEIKNMKKNDIINSKEKILVFFINKDGSIDIKSKNISDIEAIGIMQIYCKRIELRSIENLKQNLI